MHQPSKRAYTYLVDGETQELHLTYGELDRQARAIAAELQSRSAKGERALLLFPPGLGYIAAFFGCLYAEVIAVPAYPPRNSHHQARLQIIAADAQAKFALTEASLLSRRSAAAKQSQGFAQDSAPDLGTLEWIVTDALSAGQEDAWQEPIIPSDTLAFLQYTSGSTSTPKGVMVSHANILHNERVMESRFQTTEQSIFVSWLPSLSRYGPDSGHSPPLLSRISEHSALSTSRHAKPGALAPSALSLSRNNQRRPEFRLRPMCRQNRTGTTPRVSISVAGASPSMEPSLSAIQPSTGLFRHLRRAVSADKRCIRVMAWPKQPS